jgi:hypothetical protein
VTPERPIECKHGQLQCPLCAPRCEKCDAEITTGFMCAMCPHGSDCELWPTDSDPGTEVLAYRMWEQEAKRIHAELRSEVSYAEAKREELEADVAKVIRARNQWEDACQSATAELSAEREKYTSLAHAYEVQQAELEAARALLRRAEEELRLIRMKDCGAVYDTTLRIELHAATKEKPNAR